MAELHCYGDGMITDWLGHDVKPCDLKSCDECKRLDEEDE